MPGGTRRLGAQSSGAARCAAGPAVPGRALESSRPQCVVFSSYTAVLAFARRVAS